MWCCTIVLVEVDSQVYSYYIYMKYLNAIKPFEIISAIADMSILRKKDQPAQQGSSKKEEAGVKSVQQEHTLTYEQSEQFVLELRRSVSSQQAEKNAIKRKISIFENIEIEPHYLEDTENKRMIEFQFHLGSQMFLERTEVLYQQILEINKAVKTILTDKAPEVQPYFEEVQGLYEKVCQLLTRLAANRQTIARIKQRKEYKIAQLLKKKKMIKDKLYLLKNVKTKNEAAFLEITNIDQAFATQQSRVKLYKKLTKLTELQKSKYVMIIKNRLISISRGNKRLVEEGLECWIRGELSDKQIEKIAFMIYFMEKQQIYHDNQIKIDYSNLDRVELRKEVSKIFEWKKFNYVKDMSTRDRIYEFLNFLLKRIQ